MGLFSLIKSAGEKIFDVKEEAAPAEEKSQLKATALLAHIQALGLAFKTLKVSVMADDSVAVSGEVEQQADSEKIVLALGNVDGVETVDNQMIVAVPAPEARYHTVVRAIGYLKHIMVTLLNMMSFLKLTNLCYKIQTRFIPVRF